MAVSTMHEKMEERAKRQQEVGEIGDSRDDMRAVLGPEEIAGYRKKAEKDERAAGA
jgi:Xaa-Pro aminopeptidase